MIDDKAWDERMNRRIGQWARHAHAEILRMAAEARAQIDRPKWHNFQGGSHLIHLTADEMRGKEIHVYVSGVGGK